MMRSNSTDGGPYFLGIDVGSTKTHALIGDGAGRALGLGWAGPGNQQNIGYAGMRAAIAEATAQALTQAGLSAEAIQAAGAGISGFDWPSQHDTMRATVQEATGVAGPIAVVNDAVLGLSAGTSAGWGVALVAGTSNNCRGRDPQGREGRVVGDGSPFGEFAGAGELVGRAVQVVSMAWSLRGPATALTAALVDAAGAQSADDLIEGLARGWYRLGPSLAPLVFAVAQAGDPVAQEIIAWAGRELGGLAGGVIRQLRLEAAPVEVVLVGSMFKGGSLLLDPLRATIQAVAPGARLLPLAGPPVIGGVLLALEAAGHDPTPYRAPLLASTLALPALRAEQAAERPPAWGQAQPAPG